jgi:hypothetical protein
MGLGIRTIWVRKDNSRATLGCKVVPEVTLLYSLTVSVTVRTSEEL